MITPIQRVPRYVLLLEQLLIHTYKSHKDRKNLVIAYHSIQEVAQHINTQKRVSDDQERIKAIEKVFRNKHDFSKNGRMVISEGEIKSKKIRHVYYIMNDAILVGVEKSSMLSKKISLVILAEYKDVVLGYIRK